MDQLEQIKNIIYDHTFFKNLKKVESINDLNNCISLGKNCQNYIHKITNKVNLIGGQQLDPNKFRREKNINELLERELFLEELDKDKLDKLTEIVNKMKNEIKTKYNESDKQLIHEIMQLNDLTTIHIKYIATIVKSYLEKKKKHQDLKDFLNINKLIKSFEKVEGENIQEKQQYIRELDERKKELSNETKKIIDNNKELIGKIKTIIQEFIENDNNFQDIIKHMQKNENINQYYENLRGGNYQIDHYINNSNNLLFSDLQKVNLHKIDYQKGGVSNLDITINNMTNEINSLLRNYVDIHQNINNKLNKYYNFLESSKEKYKKWKLELSEKIKQENKSIEILTIGEVNYYYDVLNRIIDNWQAMGLNINEIKDDYQQNNRAIFLIRDLSLLDKSYMDKYNKNLKNSNYKYIKDSNKHQIIADKLRNLYDKYYINIKYYHFIFNKLLDSLKKDDIKPISYMNIINIEPDHVVAKLLVNFSYFKIQLDEFINLTKRLVNVYLRINDIGREGDSFEPLINKCTTIIKSGPKKKSQVVKKNINQEKFCEQNKNNYIQWKPNDTNEKQLLIDNTKCEKMPEGKQNKIRGVKFSEIFYDNMFNDNKTLSKFMLLDNLIKNNQGTLLITYGYSGVGKTYTLFGKNGKNGVLQATIENIKLTNKIDKIELRIFEIYGRGLIYSDLWKNNENIKDILIEHRFIYDDSNNRLKLDKSIEKDNLNNIKYISFPQTDYQLNNSINKFDELINDIENERKNENNLPSRIRSTINNPESSRSRIIYDFKIYLDNNKEGTHLVIDDIPGAENIIDTFIENNPYIIWNPIKKFRNFQKQIIYYVLINPIKLDNLIDNVAQYQNNTRNIYNNMDKKIENQTYIKNLIEKNELDILTTLLINILLSLNQIKISQDIKLQREKEIIENEKLGKLINDYSKFLNIPESFQKLTRIRQLKSIFAISEENTINDIIKLKLNNERINVIFKNNNKYLKETINTKNYKNLLEQIQNVLILIYSKYIKLFSIKSNVEKEIKQLVISSMEANYINQNILGIMKIVSEKSGVQDIFSKENLNNLSINNLQNKNSIQEIEDIYNQSMSNVYEINVAQKILEPYIGEGKDIIQNYDIFYILSNNKTQLKCLQQFKLYDRIQKYIGKLNL